MGESSIIITVVIQYIITHHMSDID